MPSSQGDLHKVAFDARCYASQARTYKKAWDLMSWGFDDKGIRPENVICQEAAEVIAEGGAWQCYFPQNRDASIKNSYVNVLQNLSAFVRARQAYCQYTQPVKQVAVLLSGSNEFAKNNNLFQNDNNTSVRNTLYSLLDNQIPAEVIMEHQFTGDITAYPLIVVPELGTDHKFQSQLLRYVSKGGTLLLMGTNNVDQFTNYDGIISTKANETKQVILQNNGTKYSFAVTPYVLKNGTTEIRDLNTLNDISTPIASVKAYGKGRIACFFANQKSASNDSMYEVFKKTVASLAKRLLATPVVEVIGSYNVHVTINRLEKKIIVNLVNASRANGNEIPELPPLTVKLRIAKPSKISMQPENKLLSFTYEKGICTIQVPKTELYEIIVAD